MKLAAVPQAKAAAKSAAKHCTPKLGLKPAAGCLPEPRQDWPLVPLQPSSETGMKPATTGSHLSQPPNQPQVCESQTGCLIVQTTVAAKPVAAGSKTRSQNRCQTLQRSRRKSLRRQTSSSKARRETSQHACHRQTSSTGQPRLRRRRPPPATAARRPAPQQTSSGRDAGSSSASRSSSSV